MTWGEQNTEAEAHEQLSYARDRGINFLDTAEMYPVPTKAESQGLTDRYIGSWMKTVPRDEVVLATKVSGYSDRISWVRDAGAPCRVTKDQIRESVEKSLARLQTDYVDLLQIHWPDRYVPLFGSAGYDPKERRDDAVPFEEQLEGLKAVVEEGKVRYVGVSNETSFGVTEFIRCAEDAGLPRIQSIQNSYSMLVRSAFETDLAEVCLEKDVSLLAYSPLAGGTLSGKYVRGDASDRSRLNLFPGFMERYNKSLARVATMDYMQVAEKHGLTLTAMSLAWCQSRWNVTSSIIGATSLEQLKENLDAFDVDLTDECVDDIEGVFKRLRDPSMTS